MSDQYAQLALQGPKAMEILRRLAPEDKIPTKYYHAVFDGEVGGIPCIISKTGYTGEDGVELYASADQAEKLWDLLLETGRDDGLIPCGLGARDTLRMEAAMPLYGHEMNDDVTPLETGLNFAVKMKKDDFIGKSAMEESRRAENQEQSVLRSPVAASSVKIRLFTQRTPPLRTVAKKSVTPLPAPIAHSWANRWAWH